MTPETEAYLKDIIGKIHENKACLFLGAGTSMHSGLPGGQELIERIKRRFPKANQDKSDFMDLCDDVIETPPYDRNELTEFIKEQLSKYTISDAHYQLTKYNWSTIFTTNFDDIVESAYTQSKDRLKSCYDIYGNKPEISGLADKNKVYLFKMMGTVRVNQGDGEMVLTNTDFYHSFQKRAQYYSILKDFLKNGCIVYIGYSFNDKIIKQSIDDIIKFSGGVERLPYSYALFNEPIPTVLS